MSDFHLLSLLPSGMTLEYIATKSKLSFKSIHVLYNSKIPTYLIDDSMINSKFHHKDLDIVISDDL